MTKKKRRKLIAIILSAILLITAVIIALYPTMSRIETENRIDHDISKFEIHIKKDNIIPADKTKEEAIDEGIIDEDGYVLDEDGERKYDEPAYYQADLDRLWKDSVAYNEELKTSQENRLKDDTWKEESLDLESYGVWDGIYGYIKADDIDMCLPIYLGATDWNMSLGAAHLSNTSLPIGGKGTNCVLAGHTAYFGRTFFDDIIYLQKGDIVQIQNFWETLNYKVIDTEIRVPNDGSRLFIVPNKDLLTFFTCIYSENGHYNRYYVICERI